MRTHRAFPGLQPWSTTYAADRDLLDAAHLISLRIEPVMRARVPSAVADLHFADAERTTCIPLCYVDLAQLDLREADPLVFPEAVAAHVDRDALGALLDRIVPLLEARMLRGGLHDEALIVLHDDARVATARERGFFGAAPLERSLPPIAPAIYGRRFATGDHAVTYGRGAHALGALVRAGARSVTIVDDGDEAAARWYRTAVAHAPDAALAYAVSIGDGPAPVAAEIAIRSDGSGTRTVEMTAPLPADLLVAFDAGGTPVASFGVTAAPARRAAGDDPAVDAPIVVGGSSGRIAIVVRADARDVPDADTDEAAAYAAALRAEGFAVEVTSRRDALEAIRPDLVHLFGVRPGAFAADVADWALERRVPLAVHAYFEAPAAGGYWGASVAPYCFSYSPDDRNVETYLGLLARRAVEVDGVNATTPFAPPAAGLESAERVLRVADLVFVNSAREARAVEPLRQGKPVIVVPPVGIVATGAGPAADVGPLAGRERFVLVHAPIGPEANQLVLARAMAAVGVPAVFAGPVADPVYAERVREFASETIRLAGEPEEAEARALYRGAAVVADASWVRRGQARLVSAAALGAAIVVSGDGWIDLPIETRYVVDPADVASVASGIGEAWDLATRSYGRVVTYAEAARTRLAAAHLAIVAGYAKIGQTA